MPQELHQAISEIHNRNSGSGPSSTSLLTLDGDGPKNALKLRTVYGVTSSLADAARALASGQGDIWDSTSTSGSNSHSYAVNGSFSVNSTGNGETTGSNNPTATASESGLVFLCIFRAFASNIVCAGQSGGFSRISRPVIIPAAPSHPARHLLGSSLQESVLLLKRIKALKVPPLPPALGLLTQPDDKPYRSPAGFLFLF